MEGHFLAGVLRPVFWLLVLIPLLAGVRWLVNRYLPRSFGGSKPVNDVGVAVAIIAAIIAAGLLVQ